ncbi:MAG: hypothetical protein NZ853_01150 [Leptospiraceae bacterium]|nr:hypothetical protein [Leptospiraceae bacterium]MDW7976164.1 hypothetical protein [Leptospiraceae bacterium]
MKHKLFWVFLGLLLIYFHCKPAEKRKEAETIGDFYSECLRGEITVYGEAPIFTSVSAAKNKAKEDACRKAIEKCIGSQVATYTQVSDAQSIANEIYSKAQGVCKNDRVIEEQEYMLDTVRMIKLFVKFQVEKAEIQNQINLMQKLVGNPKIMVLIREEYIIPGNAKKVYDFASRDGVGASQIRNVLIAKGYDVLDPTSILPHIRSSEIVADDPSKLSENAKDVALKAGADVLIIGNIETKPQASPAPQFKSYQATGTINILSLWGQGEIIGTYSGQAIGGIGVTDLQAAQESVKRYAVGADPNPEKKLGGFAKFAHEKLQSKWSEITRNNKIIMKISGLDPAKAGIFRDDLVERTAVKNVNEISSSQNEIIWEVIYPGREFALRDTLAFYGDDPRMFVVVKETGKKIQILDVKKGEIRLRFQ